jgi:hypothetical protein
MRTGSLSSLQLEANKKAIKRNLHKPKPAHTLAKQNMNRFALISLFFAYAQAFQLSLPIHSAKVRRTIQ